GWVRSSADAVRYTLQVAGQTRSHHVEFDADDCVEVPAAISPLPGNHRISIAMEPGPAQLDYLRLSPVR
ncbi:MAG TPA: hypothetical protein VFU02_14415, partial [Polyangiaceae bacterium]|nr:hypothetical protein [Polyangiaceae bacterium]